MSVCNFTEAYRPLVEQQAERLGANSDAFKAWLKEHFTNFDAINVSTGSNLGPVFDTGSTAPTAQTTIQTPTESPMTNQGVKQEEDYAKVAEDIANTIGSVTQTKEMYASFALNMLSCAGININLDTLSLEFNSPTEVNSTTGVNRINENILEYKRQLLNKLRVFLGQDLITSFNGPDGKIMAADDLTQLFRDTLNNAAKKKTQLQEPANLEVFKAFITLSKFDTLLKDKCKFIVANGKYKEDHEAGDKYMYQGPNVKHFSNFSSKDFESAENQVSDLVKVLLENLPALTLDANGHLTIVPGEFVGTAGYNATMLTFKDLLLFGELYAGDNSIRAALARDSFFNGAQELAFGPKTQTVKNGRKTETVTYDLIEDYIKFAEAQESATKSGVNSYYQSTRFNLNKMRALQQFLFSGKDLGEEGNFLRNCLINMFYKFERPEYRCYGYDPRTKAYRGQNVQNVPLITQKLMVQDAFAASLKALQKNISRKADLKEKYGLKKNQGQVILTTPVGTISLSYTTDHGIKIIPSMTSIDGNFEDADYQEIVKDFLGYAVPDGYATCKASPDGYNWFNDFAPFIIMGAEIIADNGLSFSLDHNRWADESNAHLGLLKIADRTSTIYGGDIKSVVKTPNQGKVPTSQLTCLALRVQSVINDVKLAGNEALERDNVIVRSGILQKPRIRNTVAWNGVEKSVGDLTVRELMSVSALDDFWIPFNDTTQDTFYLQNATFSDKSTHFLQAYSKSASLNITAEDLAELRNIDSSIESNWSLQQLMSSKAGYGLMLEYTRLQRQHRINNLRAKIIADYQAAFADQKNNPLAGKNITTLAQLYEALKNTDAKIAQSYFAAKGLAYQNNIHGPIKGAIVGNEKLLMDEILCNDKKVWEAYIYGGKAIGNEHLGEFTGVLNKYKNSIRDAKLSWYTYKDQRASNMLKALQTIGAEKTAKFYNADNHLLKAVSDDGDLLPAYEAYFYADLLLSNELGDLMIGDIAAHDSKTKKNADESAAAYYERACAKRWVAQIKRSVIYGATMHSYLQGLANGIAPTMHCAVMEDIKGRVSTTTGKYEDGQDTMDGSGVYSALQSRLENNSLLDSRVGHTKKSIVHYIDPKTGCPVLLKWAVDEITNEMRRNSRCSNVNGELLTRKMYSRTSLTGNFDLSAIYDKYVKDNGYIMYKDPDEQEVYMISSIERNEDGTYTVTRQSVNKGNGSAKGQPETLPPVTINTLYDVDQLFGGAWCCRWDNDHLEYTEANTDILEMLVTEHQELKDCMISYMVNKSAIKVGQTNINSSARWNNDEQLDTFTIASKYAGIQGDYDHDLDEAEVTEMTQMISSLIQNGYYTNTALDVYKYIGQIVANQIAPLAEALKNVDDPKAADEVYALLSKSFIDSLDGEKSTLGIAQAFVSKSKKAITDYMKANKGNKPALLKDIPFSAATITPAFVARIASDINSTAIRHKFPGFAGVLNVSYNMLQYYSYDGQTMLYEQFVDECRKALKKGNDGKKHNWVKEAQEIKNDTFWSLMENIGDIEEGDTYVIEDNQGNRLNKITAEDFFDRESVKDYFNRGYKVYKVTAYPRNLRGYDIHFTVDGKRYSVYDLDSVRVANYFANDHNVGSTPVKVLISFLEHNKIGDGQTPLLKSETNAASLLQILAKDYQKTDSFDYVGLISQLKLLKKGDEIYDTFKPKSMSDVQHLWSLNVRPELKICLIAAFGGNNLKTWANNVTQQILRKMDAAAGRVDGALGEDVNIQRSLAFGEGDAVVQIGDAEMRMPEIIMGRYQAEQMGLDDNAHINKILSEGPNYFAKKLRRIFDTRHRGFADHLMYKIDNLGKSQKEKFYVRQLGKDANGQPIPIDKYIPGTIVVNDNYIHEEGKIYHIDSKGKREYICDDPQNHINFYTYYGPEENATKETLITIESHNDYYKYLERSRYFEKYKYDHFAERNVTAMLSAKLDKGNGKQNTLTLNGNTYTIEQLQKAEDNAIDLKSFVEELAEEVEKEHQSDIERSAQLRFDAFKQQLTCMGARIPTQAMSSYMPMNVVAYTNDKSNGIFVNRMQTFLEGSDYKVDKKL